MRRPLFLGATLALFVLGDGGTAVALRAPAADPQRWLAEIESIYAEALASKQIKLAPADGHPSILLVELPRHVEALRGSLQQLATEPGASADPSPAVLAWYEAHRIRAILPLVAEAKAPCEGLTYQPGDPFCPVIEPDARARLAGAIEELISALPALSGDRDSLGYVPAHGLTVNGALREAILIFEVAAHADERTDREWSRHPASPLGEAEAEPHLDGIRRQLYELSARASYMRFGGEIRGPLAEAIRTISATAALPGADRSWIAIRLRLVEMLIDHWGTWGEC